MNETRGSVNAALLVAVGLGASISVLGAGTLGQALGSPILLTAVLALVGAGASIPVARRWAGERAAGKQPRAPRALLVGAGPTAEHLADQARAEGYHVLGTVEDFPGVERLDWPEEVMAPRSALPELALCLRADQILIADSPSGVWDLVEQLERQDVPAEIYLVPEAYELALCRPTSTRLGDVALVRVPRRRIGWAYRIAKRVTDVSASVGLLAFSAPLLVLAAAAIRLSSPGPILFRQERIGKNGARFEIIKLRTMVADAEKDGPQLCAGTEDPRLTRVGSFLRATHIDEFPQLWNVLRGEMSLVGPRPERPVFVEQFERQLPRYGERHRIAPGITGLAQINGYYHSSPREKLRFDLMYVYHPSLWLDVTIIIRTFIRIFV